MKIDERNGTNSGPNSPAKQNGVKHFDSSKSDKSDNHSEHGSAGTNGMNGVNGVVRHQTTKPPMFEHQVGYRPWVAQAGTLIADLLTCAGADHVITMDLHGMYSRPEEEGFLLTL